MNIIKTILLLPFFILASCETLTDWTETIIPGEDEVIEDNNDNQELLSDSEEIRDPTLEEILADAENEENFEIAEEQLSPAPADEYDSVLITEDNETQISNNEIVQPSQIIENETTQSGQITDDNLDKVNEINNSDDKISNQTSFKAPESLFSSLNLKEKIQYRIATINFRSGSSSVDGNGLKKIKKIVKIAKDRNAKIKVIGHASERTKDMPIAEHKIVNFMISDKRAHSVANIFIEKYGFPRNKLITEAVSDSKPLFKEIMPAGTKANQRTEIFLIY